MSTDLDRRPELFFAFVAPVGADLETAHRALVAELREVGYTAETLKLSASLAKLKPFEALAAVRDDLEHIRGFMNAGDELREEAGFDAVAVLGVTEVIERRGEPGRPRPGVAYVFRSLKHRSEVETLRAIYGQLLLVISLFDARDDRHTRLRNRLERKTPETADEEARNLMERDEEGTTIKKHGQDVGNAFPRADFFVDGAGDINGQIRRFVRLTFRDHEQGPFPGEYAMAVAQAAARRSADLSRQVGAAILGEHGEIVSVGYNEVPKPGGGVYLPGDEPDGRDLRYGKDPNATMGTEILREIFGVLHRNGLLSAELLKLKPEEVVSKIRTDDILRGARVRNLIEFGRVVHAEMNALAHAARHGIPVRGGRLYCTTFPCHVCARHLLAAGITEVFYVEPYPKSLAEELYPKAICRSTTERPGWLTFRPFSGVAPARYLEWFEFGSRKDPDGYALRFDPATARSRIRNPGPGYLALERQFSDNLFEKLKSLDWI